MKHPEYVKQPQDYKEEDLIQTQISDKDNESKVSSQLFLHQQQVSE